MPAASSATGSRVRAAWDEAVQEWFGGARTVAAAQSSDDTASFGAVASYQICACCARYHGPTDATFGGDGGAFLNADDRGVFGPNGKPSLISTDAGAQITRLNHSWATGLGTAATVTYAFRESATTMPLDMGGFTQFNAAQIAGTQLAFAAWAEVANITFQRVQNAGSQYSNNATILLGNFSSGLAGAAGFAYFPGPFPGYPTSNAVQGDIWIQGTLSYNATPVQQGYGQLTLLHEIGHAIGLQHPADYDASSGAPITYAANATYYEDSGQYTVMSYFSERETGANFRTNGVGSARYASSPLMDDIAAAQRLYGANMTTRTGDTTYGFNSNAGQPWFLASGATSPLIFCTWDAGGIDTFNFSGFTAASTIDLRQGAFSSVGGLIGNVSIAIGAVIENVIGGQGADAIRGSSGANRITGNGGADSIDGGLGTDTVVFSGPHAEYTIVWNGQVGTVSAAGQATVAVTNVEFLQFADQTIAAAPTGGLMVAGDITNETITGTALADIIGGLGGADTINGLAGNDLLIGGLGNDVLNGGDGADVADYSGAGTGVTVNLVAGTATGGAGVDTLSQVEGVTGSAFADTLAGDAADNVLRGGGGVDTISGDAGADQLYAGAPVQSGGAPDIVKAQGTANATIATAVSLTGGFDLLPVSGISDSGSIPHATVFATTHGGVEYYAVTVVAGDTVRFDIDNAGFDSTLRLFDVGGAELAKNDDNNPDGGSSTDSMLVHTFTAGGTYYIQVAEWSGGGGSTFTSAPPAAGQTYALHVSVPSAPVVPLTLVGSTLHGGFGDDRLEGGSGVDTLNGDENDDTLIGAAGDDLIHGGDGNDMINAGTGIDEVYGDAGADLFLISAVTTGQQDSVFYGGAGTDTFDASAVNIALVFDGVSLDGQFTVGDNTVTGVEVVRGGSLGDQLAFQAFSTALDLFGDGGDDSLQGGSGFDRLYGGIGGDLIAGTAGDQLYGEDGDDGLTVTGSTATANVLVAGGAGVDNLSLFGASTTLDLVTGVGTVGSTDLSVSGVENVGLAGTGSGARTVLGTSEANRLEVLAGGSGFSAVLDGRGGDDLIIGGALGDTLVGGTGLDQLFGAAGSDTLDGDAGDQLYGEDGDDTLVFTGSVAVSGSVVSGGAGLDTARLVGLSTSVDLAAGTGTVGSTAVTLSGLENVIVEGAGAGVRTVLGSDDANVFTVGLLATGSVDFDGRSGDDSLTGSAQDDTLRGGAGNDALDGGLGFDIADYAGAAGGVIVTLLTGVASNDGNGGSDTLTGIEALSGSAFNDTLTGDGGANVLRGRGGVDVLAGGGGIDTVDYSLAAAGMRAQLNTNASSNDGDGATDTFSGIENLTGSAFNDVLIGDAAVNVLRGGAGADTLLGLAGNDTLWGGAGALNTLQGGTGDDTYVLEVADSIVENVGEGTDTVDARINTYVLANNVERLVFGGTGNFAGTGNALANVITGGTGTDTLRGRGGIDVLNGGLGIDTADYTLAAAGVVARIDLQRATNDGDGATDTYTGIENLIGSNFNDTLIGDVTANVLMGGVGADTLLGFGGNDILWGGSGGGNNQMQGGTGDDWYILDAFDTCVEFANEGIDTVEARIGSYTMGAHIENLIFGGLIGSFVGTGNVLDNTITGGAGNDILRGRGGNDIINGGAGTDEVQLRGVAANYTVTQIGATWQIVDSVGGRDGTTTVTSIERLRFSDNTTQVLTYPAPGALEPVDKGADVVPQVLPGLSDGDFVPVAKDADTPLVLPATDGLEALAGGDRLVPPTQQPGRMLTLGEDGTVSGASSFGGRHDHDGWLF